MSLIGDLVGDNVEDFTELFWRSLVGLTCGNRITARYD